MTGRKLVPHCAECGGLNVLFDSYARWDVEKQDYTIVNVFDKPTICDDCEGVEVSVEWREVSDGT